MSALTAFDFEQTPVRVFEREDGSVWFVAADVCRALGIKNNRDALEKLDDDEKGVGLSDTLGGSQEMNIISEGGLYTLVLRSRQATTPGTVPHRFRKWVTGEVIPQIRRTGRYEAPEAGLDEDERDCVGITDAIGRDRETIIIDDDERGAYSVGTPSGDQTMIVVEGVRA